MLESSKYIYLPTCTFPQHWVIMWMRKGIHQNSVHWMI